MQDHFIDGRSETQIPSGQILTDGLDRKRGAIIRQQTTFQTGRMIIYYYITIITFYIGLYTVYSQDLPSTVQWS